MGRVVRAALGVDRDRECGEEGLGELGLYEKCGVSFVGRGERMPAELTWSAFKSRASWPMCALAESEATRSSMSNWLMVGVRGLCQLDGRTGRWRERRRSRRLGSGELSTDKHMRAGMSPVRHTRIPFVPAT